MHLPVVIAADIALAGAIVQRPDIAVIAVRRTLTTEACITVLNDLLGPLLALKQPA